MLSILLVSCKNLVERKIHRYIDTQIHRNTDRQASAIFVGLVKSKSQNHKMLSLKNFYTAECPDGWTGYAKKCYKFFGETTSWDHAQTYCRKMGSFLASIENKETNDFISGTLLKHLPDTKPTPYLQVYIGGQQIKEGGYTGEYWAWTDGSWFGYSNWLAGNYDIGNEDCMSMFLKMTLSMAMFAEHGMMFRVIGTTGFLIFVLNHY